MGQPAKSLRKDLSLIPRAHIKKVYVVSRDCNLGMQIQSVHWGSLANQSSGLAENQTIERPVSKEESDDP